MNDKNSELMVFKPGCHAIHELMGEKGLGKTGESSVKTWYLQKLYKRKQKFFSKYVEKGLATEKAGIELYSQWLNEGVLLDKNENWFQNDFILGCPDLIHDNIVTDIKCSWDLFTFPYFDEKLPKQEYYWQVQGYMALTNLRQARVAYCLIDTPKPIIQQELKGLYYKSGGRPEDWTPETYAELEVNYRFDDIPFENRIRVFDIARNEADIALIYSRVEKARAYLEQCLKSLKK